MRNYVDTHCHILPGIDDGPATTEQALALAEALVDAGFSQAIATPHFADNLSAEYLALIRVQYGVLTKALREADIPLLIHLGAEILLSPEVLRLAKKEPLPTLSGTPYILIELPFYQTISSYTFDAIFSLQAMGYRPILAHPERVGAIKGNFEILRQLVKSSIRLQVNMGSLTGYFGQKAKHTAEKIITNGLCHILATDSHDAAMTGLIKPVLRDKSIPIQTLLQQNPQNLLAGKPLETITPEETPTYKERIRRFFAAS